MFFFFMCVRVCVYVCVCVLQENKPVDSTITPNGDAGPKQDIGDIFGAPVDENGI